jgi:hypothetical protein
MLFRGEKRLEGPFRIGETYPAVLNFNQNRGRVALLCADYDFPRTITNGVHRIKAIHQQVQNELLNLDAISKYRLQVLLELGFDGCAASYRLRSEKPDDFDDEAVQVEHDMLDVGTLEQGPNPPHNLDRVFPIADDPLRGFTRSFQIRGLGAKPTQAGVGIGDHRSKRLIDLVRNRGCELSHRGVLGCPGEASFCPTQGFLDIPSIIDIDQQAIPLGDVV